MPQGHLSQQERYAIAIYRSQGMSRRQIAEKLGRAPSTISREIKRNTTADQPYEAASAHQQATKRRSQSNRVGWKVNQQMIEEIAKRLGWEYSPDLISGSCRNEGIAMVSTEWIYEVLYRDRLAGGALWRGTLRKRPERKKRGRRRDHRGQIPDRVMISERPAEVAARARVGDWESDTISGRRNRGGLVVAVERQSRYVRFQRVSKRTSEQTSRALEEMLRKEVVQTITTDNGKEFAAHQQVARGLKVEIYFCDPYTPSQRGSCEHVNGMIRRYFPKGTDFAKVSEAELRRVEYLLNNRPRKLLGYCTPWEVYSGRAKPPRGAFQT